MPGKENDTENGNAFEHRKGSTDEVDSLPVGTACEYGGGPTDPYCTKGTECSIGLSDRDPHLRMAENHDDDSSDAREWENVVDASVDP